MSIPFLIHVGGASIVSPTPPCPYHFSIHLRFHDGFGRPLGSGAHGAISPFHKSIALKNARALAAAGAVAQAK